MRERDLADGFHEGSLDVGSLLGPCGSVLSALGGRGAARLNLFDENPQLFVEHLSAFDAPIHDRTFADGGSRLRNIWNLEHLKVGEE